MALQGARLSARLSAGDRAPSFTVIALGGGDVSLQDFREKRLLLSFFRYGSCPLCNLRMSFLIEAYPRLHIAGLEMVAVFESPPDVLRETVGRQRIPFPVIADPHRTLYKRYRVTPSLFGYVRGALRFSAFREAFRKGFHLGRVDGAITQLPAEFLINEDGVIVRAYYGKDIGDHLPLDEIETWAAREV